MNNYLVTISNYDGEAVVTIVKGEIELIVLLNLLIESKTYRLENVERINYEGFGDLVYLLKQENKPQDLNFGQDKG